MQVHAGKLGRNRPEFQFIIWPEPGRQYSVDLLKTTDTEEIVVNGPATLGRNEVRELIAHLQAWVNTGNLRVAEKGGSDG